MTLIDGFAFRGYRSFSSDSIAQLYPLEKVNLIAGQNNTGKSNILRMIAQTYSNNSAPASQWDRPLGDSNHMFARYQFHRIDEVIGWQNPADLPPDLLAKVSNFLAAPELAFDGFSVPGIWLGVGKHGAVDNGSLQQAAVAIGENQLARDLSMRLTSSGGGGVGEDSFRVLKWVFSNRPGPPAAVTVGGVRSISEGSDQPPDLNGMSIKRRLLELQNPSTDRLIDKEVFVEVQEFVRAVLEDSSITIDIPHDLSTVHVTQAGRTLPIENIGTGIHEVVIIAAAATITQNSIVCIEEPEVHLHPVLQRKLLRYLAERTSNQYFVATHSAHILDSSIGSIFHVTRDEGVSSVRYAGVARDRAAICADLGYRPSDLVQTNAMLWVEGPSDRTYLKNWIERLAPGEFIEGTHYSIMFYGGSLLSALSPLDAEEVDEFISLRNLNRYMMVLIDSDKRRSSDPINSSKQRVVEDLARDPSTGFAWVTAGYTIENYAPQEVLSSAIRAAHPSSSPGDFTPQKKWANPLDAERIGIRQPSKVAIAKKAIEEWGDEWPLDLKPQVQKVIELIKTANMNS